MANPTLAIPHLPKPDSNDPPASSSRQSSPTRQTRNASHHSPVRSSSPDTTLRAIRAAQRSNQTTVNDTALFTSINKATPAERALGIKILQVCQNVQIWASQVESWSWPDTFQAPAKMPTDSNGRQESYLGSLPKAVVDEHEHQVQDIRFALSGIDADVLKDYLRELHVDSDDSSAHTRIEHDSNAEIDELSSIVTASILKALPYLPWLTSLLDDWTLRLATLHKASQFLDALATLQTAFDHAKSTPSDMPQRDSVLAESTKPATQSLMLDLKDRIFAVGRMLDDMLDDLDGRPETLPDTWIDHFEELEADCHAWIEVTARKMESDHIDDRTSAAQPVSPIDAAYTFFDPSNHRSVSPEPRIESPILGQARLSQKKDKHQTQQHDTTSDMGQDVIDQLLAEVHQVDSIQSDDIIIYGDHGGMSAVIDTVPSFPVFLPEESEVSTPPVQSNRRPRHIPIDVSAYAAAAAVAANSPEIGKTSDALTPLLEEPLTELDARQQNAVEPPATRSMSDVLQKANSPERSSDTTSSTFSKLFSRSEAHHSRSGSNSSRSSFRYRMSPPSISIRSSMSSKRTSDQSIYRTISIGSTSRDKRFLRRSDDIAEITSMAVSDAARRPQWPGQQQSTPQSNDNHDSLPRQEPAIQQPSEVTADEQRGRRLSQDARTDVPAETRDDEDNSPDMDVMLADSFERFFVDSLPTSPSMSTSSFAGTDVSHRGILHRASSSMLRKLPLHGHTQSIPAASMVKRIQQESRSKSATRSMSKKDQTVSKRASVASIEQYARSQVKTVNIPRSRSPSTSPDDINDGSRPYKINAPLSKIASHSYTKSASSFAVPNVESSSMTDEAKNNSTTTGDRLDIRISTIIDQLPSPIRFEATPQKDVKSTGNGKSSPALHAATNTRPSEETLRLVPARDSRYTSQHARDGRTYLLLRSTGGDPIKLFIRLVGDHERAMVRVGGGWADLAEFLRQFVEHHGSKAPASGPRVVQQLPSSTATFANRTKSGTLSSLSDRNQDDQASDSGSSHGASPIRTPNLGSSSPMMTSPIATPNYVFHKAGPYTTPTQVGVGRWTPNKSTVAGSSSSPRRSAGYRSGRSRIVLGGD